MTERGNKQRRSEEIAQAVGEKNRLEKEINELFVNTFDSPHGQKVLNYLKNLTIYHVPSADSSNEKLQQQLGQRLLVAHIMERANSGKKT